MIFEKIEPALRERAKEIENFCSRKLDYLHGLNCFRYYTDHGPAHSKAILELFGKLLDSISLKKGGRLNEYEYFILYNSAWCHDLGLLSTEEDRDLKEKFSFTKFCEFIRKNHSRRSFNFINNKWRDMGIQNETEANLIGIICKVHSAEEDINQLSEDLAIPIENNVKTVRTRFLAALLRLADTLDAKWDRLPPRENINEEISEISRQQIMEYWKHEVVRRINIDHEREEILVDILIKREYPPKADIVGKVKKKLESELESVRKILEDYGISLNFKFSVNESQIKERLGEEELEAYSDAYKYYEELSLVEEIKNPIKSMIFEIVSENYPVSAATIYEAKDMKNRISYQGFLNHLEELVLEGYILEEKNLYTPNLEKWVLIKKLESIDRAMWEGRIGEFYVEKSLDNNWEPYFKLSHPKLNGRQIFEILLEHLEKLGKERDWEEVWYQVYDYRRHVSFKKNKRAIIQLKLFKNWFFPYEWRFHISHWDREIKDEDLIKIISELGKKVSLKNSKLKKLEPKLS
nr:hypothetical protein [Candidatus Freyarchaeota archaeon]